MKILKQAELDLFIAIFPTVFAQSEAVGDAITKTLDVIEIALESLHEAGIIKNDASKVAALKVRPPNKFQEL